MKQKWIKVTKHKITKKKIIGEETIGFGIYKADGQEIIDLGRPEEVNQSSPCWKPISYFISLQSPRKAQKLGAQALLKVRVLGGVECLKIPSSCVLLFSWLPAFSSDKEVTGDDCPEWTSECETGCGENSAAKSRYSVLKTGMKVVNEICIEIVRLPPNSIPPWSF